MYDHGCSDCIEWSSDTTPVNTWGPLGQLAVGLCFTHRYHQGLSLQWVHVGHRPMHGTYITKASHFNEFLRIFGLCMTHILLGSLTSMSSWGSLVYAWLRYHQGPSLLWVPEDHQSAHGRYHINKFLWMSGLCMAHIYHQGPSLQWVPEDL